MHELRACGLVEQELANVAHLGIGWIKQNRANLFGDSHATGFTQTQHIAPRELKRTR